MQHDRMPLGRAFVHVLGAQALGHHEVHLHGAQLPGAADGVLEVVFDLRAVERALARQLFPGHAAGRQRGAQGGLGLVPGGVVAQARFRAQGDLDLHVLEAEVLVDLQGLAMEVGDFRLHLVRGAEDVAVVLGEAAHAQDAVQRARGFVAVAGAELAVADGQVAVAVQALVEHLHVARAVHRLERVGALLGLGEEHVLLVVVPVAGLLPQGNVEDLRAAHFLVARAAVDAAHVLLHHLPQLPALGMPEHQARRFFLQVEELELAGDLAVVALLGFLQLREVGLEVLVVEPGGAVDAAEHLVVVVTAPVGAGHLHQLERAQPVGARHVRAAAQVGELALRVQRQVFAGRDRFDDLGLVVLADALEEGHGLVARLHAARHRQRFLDDLLHLGLDGRQVFGRERTLVGEVVEEAAVDHRADGDLGAGEQALHGLGQQVGGGVAQHVQRVGMLVGDDLERGVVGDDEAGVHQLAVHLAAQGGLGQARADGQGDVGDADGVLEGAAAAVGERDVDHGVPGRRSTGKKKGRQAPFAFARPGCCLSEGGSAHVARSAPVSRGHLGFGR